VATTIAAASAVTQNWVSSSSRCVGSAKIGSAPSRKRPRTTATKSATLGSATTTRSATNSANVSSVQ